MSRMAYTGPEHEQTRLPVIQALKTLGWSDRQMQWKPEWRVPKTPSEAAKREGGHSFQSYPVDLVLFEDPEAAPDWQNVLAIFELKKPTYQEGYSQLETYLGLEPRARFGVWSNGTESAVIWKLPDGTFKTTRSQQLRLPKPADDFTIATSKAITWKDLQVPSELDLRSSFKALLDVVIARDSAVTRSEMQLDQLCNLLLVKLESDTRASYSVKSPVMFQLRKDAHETAAHIRKHFLDLVKQHSEVFRDEHSPQLILDDHTIQEVVYAWSAWNLLEVKAEAVSNAFQVFRRANLKAGEGQYFTPARVISAAVEAMDIVPADKIIDPACGTGGFLIEAFTQMEAQIHDREALRRWASKSLFGVDKDSINVKLTRAMMIALGDGSTHIHIGDSIREDRWDADYPDLSSAMADETYTVVLTNPPFGVNLKVAARDSEENEYTIASASNDKYRDIEIGLIFLERAHRLLRVGGRLGIILPETYFFSSSYSYLHDWLESRFAIRGLINIPMEAFQGFCRAKTNLYIMEKTGKGNSK